MPQDRDIYLSTYSPALPHFSRVPTRRVEQVTEVIVWVHRESRYWNWLKCGIYYKNHNLCYFFTDTSNPKWALLSTFLFGTKCVIYEVTYLHIPKPNIEISVEVSPDSEMSISVIFKTAKGVREKEGRALPKKNSQTSERE